MIHTFVIYYVDVMKMCRKGKFYTFGSRNQNFTPLRQLKTPQLP